MSAVLVLLVLAAAAWFGLSLVGRGGVGREPTDSISEFSRAMGALDPSRPRAHSAAATHAAATHAAAPEPPALSRGPQRRP